MILGSKEHRSDIKTLMETPAFIRFLWRLIQHADILRATTNGTDTRDLSFFEGRRSLGFDLLREIEMGLPVSHSDGMPVMALLAVLREEAQPQPSAKEAKREREDTDQSTDRDRDEHPDRV
jgi:hypothetical protein